MHLHHGKPSVIQKPRDACICIHKGSGSERSPALKAFAPSHPGFHRNALCPYTRQLLIQRPGFTLSSKQLDNDRSHLLVVRNCPPHLSREAVVARKELSRR